MERDDFKQKIILVMIFTFFFPLYGNFQFCDSHSIPDDMKSNKNGLFPCTPLHTRLLSSPAWAYAYGGGISDAAYSIHQTSDGGYIVAGETYSFADGPYDIWVLKLYANGAVAWQNAYGGTIEDKAFSIQQTFDGGYIIAGWTSSFGAGNDDFWVLKLDANGAIVWQNTYGGGGADWAFSIQQTSDKGYIVAGFTGSYGAGSADALVLKLNVNGAVVWQNTYGEGSDDIANSIQQTSDGGYVVAGFTNSFGAGDYDIWVVKLDANGAVIWQKTYGGSSDDEAKSIQQISDGGYIVAGYTYSFGAGNADYWVLKLDGNGTIVWQNTYGGSGYDVATSIQQISDGGYIVAGRTSSFGAGNYDIWVLKLDINGAVIWQKTYGGSSDDEANSIQQTSDEGYIVAGFTSSFGAGNADYWVLKLDANGEIGTSCSSIANTIIIPSPTSITPSDSATLLNAAYVFSYNTLATAQSTAATPAEQCAADYIYLQPYLRAKPVVDDSGSSTVNGIIEPDESILLQGHLQNLGNIDATNTTGILSTIDPINITQPNAMYGTILSGSDKYCITCNTLTAPLASRPATHWDFHVIEQLSADGYEPTTFQYIYHVGNSFSDADASYPFYSYIEKLLHSGVTSGCTTSTFCPDNNVLRQQMAKFICAAMEASQPGSCTINSLCSGTFNDVHASNPFCPYIENLYYMGITAGCQTAPLKYCPNDTVQRQAMAKFVCLGMESSHPGSCIDAGCSGIFKDVPSSNSFCIYIEALYNASIIDGCGSDLYCPEDLITRGQMAKFLVNGFGFTL